MEMGGVWDIFKNAIMKLAMTIDQCDSTFSVKLVLSPSDSERLVGEKSKSGERGVVGLLKMQSWNSLDATDPLLACRPIPPDQCCTEHFTVECAFKYVVKNNAVAS